MRGKEVGGQLSCASHPVASFPTLREGSNVAFYVVRFSHLNPAAAGWLNQFCWQFTFFPCYYSLLFRSLGFGRTAILPT
jgi:hypothetical protein